MGASESFDFSSLYRSLLPSHSLPSSLATLGYSWIGHQRLYAVSPCLMKADFVGKKLTRRLAVSLSPRRVDSRCFSPHGSSSRLHWTSLKRFIDFNLPRFSGRSNRRHLVAQVRPSFLFPHRLQADRLDPDLARPFFPSHSIPFHPDGSSSSDS